MARFRSGHGDRRPNRRDLRRWSELVDLSWLEAEAPPPEVEVVEDSEPVVGEDASSSDAALAMSLASPKPEADDDVHFGVAARALGVSRRTVERMVKRGQLERGPSNAPATVSEAFVGSRARATPPGCQPSDAGDRD